MKSRQCTFCPAMIAMIFTPNRKWAPVDPHPVRRMGSAPLAKGMYYDDGGNIYDENDVPNGVRVYRAHFPDCPGAEEARKK